MKVLGLCTACVSVVGLVTAASGMTMDTVPVGNPGNPPDTRYATPGYGSVAYNYRIGKYEVTAGQYCEFLNAVAKVDSYGLYSRHMDTNENRFGCGIVRGGSQGNYYYTIDSGWRNRPVNWVSWGSAARFCNWLANSQPTGVLTGDPFQDAWLTEDGSYELLGCTEFYKQISRRSNATYVIPSENEWYKAAYYDPVHPGGPGYWDYPTRNDTAPSNDLTDPDPGNNATYYRDLDYTVGAPYYRTEVGAHENSGSPYDTFDQGGNVSEWNESVISELTDGRGIRGGSFSGGGLGDVTLLQAFARGACSSTPGSPVVGFRIAYVPEPSMFLLVILGIGMVSQRRLSAPIGGHP